MINCILTHSIRRDPQSSKRFAHRVIINLGAVSITRNQRRSFRERGANESTTANPFAALNATLLLHSRPDALFVWRVMHLPLGVPRVNNETRRRNVRSCALERYAEMHAVAGDRAFS